MKLKCIVIGVLSVSGILTACSSNDPGPLAGTWKIDGPIPIVTQFRSGEVETLGIIEKVSYDVKGNDIYVTSKDGIAKGLKVHYQIKNENTVSNGISIMNRIR